MTSKDELQQAVLDAMVDTCKKNDAGVSDGMGAIMSAALQAFIIISETAGRNTLRDLYSLRRQLSALISNYKINGTI